VLNASRHHRYFHHCEPGSQLYSDDVLNASRHHRYFHRLSRYWRKNENCAQRLAASQVLSRGRTGCRCRRVRRAQRLAASQVLSPLSSYFCLPASTCSTPRGITGTFTIRTFEVSTGGACAQRLAASQVLSPANGAKPWAVKEVLNASRHHRYFHRLKLEITRRAADVLNASRHHRYFHLRGYWYDFSGNTVLNASRHHRYFHTILPAI